MLKNLRRHIQSSTSLPSHLLRYTSINHCHFECNCSATAIHWQCQTIPHHQAVASTSILAEIARELAQTHPIKCEPSLYLLKYTSIKYCHFECYCGAAAIHPQYQTIPHHQAITSTSILAKIARELTQTHPIKCEPSLTPPKVHINQTFHFQMWLLHHCHPPTMPNNSPSSGYCLHINSHKNAWELAKIHPIKCISSLTHPKVHIDQTLPFWMQLWRHCHPLTIPNNSLPSGYCLHIDSRKNAWELAKIHPIKHEPSLTHTS